MWMIAGSVGSMVVVSSLLDADQRAAAWAGMIGPLLAVSATWALVERASSTPGRVTTVLLHGFAAKVAFFLVYVVLAVRVLAFDPVPFVVSFTIYFVALYASVAVWLQRRFTGSLHQAR
jgi:hypothetical protein